MIIDVDRDQTPEDEDEAEDNMSRPRSRPRTKFRPRGQSGLEDLTSLDMIYDPAEVCSIWQWQKILQSYPESRY